MKKFGMFLCAALCTAFLTLSAAPPDNSWLTDYAKAQTEAKAKKLPILLAFTREGSQECKKFDSSVLKDGKFKAFAKNKFVFVYVSSTEKEPAAVAKQFQVSTYPTVVLADSNGKTLGKLNEENEKEFLTKLIKMYPNVKKEVGGSTEKKEKKEKSEKKK